jgi:hypothetical protein
MIQVIEVRKVDARLPWPAGRARLDERDPPIERYDPYGPGATVIDDAGDQIIDD